MRQLRDAAEKYRCAWNGALDFEEEVYVTGVPAGNTGVWQQLAPGDVIFIGADRPHTPLPAPLQLTHAGRASAMLKSAEVSVELWGSGEYEDLVVIHPLVPLEQPIDLAALATRGFGYASVIGFCNHDLNRPKKQWALEDEALKAELRSGVARLAVASRTAPPLGAAQSTEHSQGGSQQAAQSAAQPQAARPKRPRDMGAHGERTLHGDLHQSTAESVALEGDHLDGESFDVTGTDARTARRTEQGMVLEFAEHLRAQGHRVTARRYHCGGPAPLRCDLLDETTGVLYEAKSVPERREDVQKGVGQLFTYRQAEEASGASGVRIRSLALLLPRALDPLMAATLKRTGIDVVVWQHER